MPLHVTGLCPLIQVHDMPEAMRFYCELLGFSVVDRSPEVETPEGRFSHWARLRLGGAELMLNTAHDAGERPPGRDAARQAAHGDTVLYFGCSDVDGAYETLRAKGLRVKPPRVAPYGMKQLAVRDPDGYQLCFQAEAV